MANHQETTSSDRGAVLVHTALALLGLMALSTFVIDYGVLLAARRQAQNAADAAALAGAGALAFDDLNDFTNSGPAKSSAYAVLMAHRLWGDAPVVDLDADITFPTCPDDPSSTCIRVDVYRNQAHGNPLPMFFGRLVGIASQNVRAMAMARVAAGNATDCMKPFAVPDFYSPDLDSYSAPGYTLATHLGQTVLLKGGPGTQLSPGWFRLLDLAGGSGGGTGGPTGTVAQIKSCVADVHGVGESLQDQHGNIGNNVSKAINDLYDLDPDAYYDSGLGKVVNSCADDGTCEKIVYTGNGNSTTLVPDPGRTNSPRILMIPVFDPVIFFNGGGGYPAGTIKVVNILGFFVTQPMAGPPDFDLYGVLVTQSGMLINVPGSGGVPAPAGFLKVISLIR